MLKTGFKYLLAGLFVMSQIPSSYASHANTVTVSVNPWLQAAFGGTASNTGCNCVTTCTGYPGQTVDGVTTFSLSQTITGTSTLVWAQCNGNPKSVTFTRQGTVWNDCSAQCTGQSAGVEQTPNGPQPWVVVNGLWMGNAGAPVETDGTSYISVTLTANRTNNGTNGVAPTLPPCSNLLSTNCTPASK